MQTNWFSLSLSLSVQNKSVIIDVSNETTQDAQNVLNEKQAARSESE